MASLCHDDDYEPVYGFGGKSRNTFVISGDMASAALFDAELLLVFGNSVIYFVQSLGRNKYRGCRISKQKILIIGQIPQATKFILRRESREIGSFQLWLFRFDIILDSIICR